MSDEVVRKNDGRICRCGMCGLHINYTADFGINSTCLDCAKSLVTPQTLRFIAEILDTPHLAPSVVISSMGGVYSAGMWVRALADHLDQAATSSKQQAAICQEPQSKEGHSDA